MLKLMRPPDRVNDDGWQAENLWVQNFLTDDEDLGARVLAHAVRRYDEATKRNERLEDKCGELVRTAGTLAGLEVAAFSALKPQVMWPFWASLVCLILAVLLCVRMRAPRKRPMMLSVRELADGAVTTTAAQRDSWQAGSIHLTTEAYWVFNNWIARWLTVGHVLFAIAVGLLLPWALSAR